MMPARIACQWWSRIERTSSRTLLSAAIFAVGCFCLPAVSATVDPAEPMTVAALKSLLRAPLNRELRFEESHESRWLSAPAVSSGSMTSNGQMLEKRVERPRRETWQIHADHLGMVSPETGGIKRIEFADMPAVAALANALRQVLAGDLQALEPVFRLEAGGNARIWTLQLTPRSPEGARYLSRIELQGSGPQLQVIIVVQPQGDRTTTRLSYPP